MSDKFRDKYRIPSSRLSTHNYSSNGYYFITICTQNRENYLGEVINDTMKLSKIGTTAQNYWQEIPKHFPFVKLDEFVIMPNHIHGIIIINNIVETQNFASLPKSASLQQKMPQNQFGPQSKNLASIVRGYKIGVKKFVTINNLNFSWQPRFYDSIIKNEKSLNRIREYIHNNAKNWNYDENNK